MSASALRHAIGIAMAVGFRTVVIGLAIYGGLDLIRGVMAQDESAYLPSVAQAAQVESLESRVAALENKLQHVTAGTDAITVTGANLWVVNGAGATGTANGLGNVIIGYNEPRAYGRQDNDRSGSHMLVVGKYNNYSAFGGLVAGIANSATAPWSSVSGGWDNVASGERASVCGGEHNEASGIGGSVIGGIYNAAIGEGSSVSGGQYNQSAGMFSSVSGGERNVAGGRHASVSGGHGNTAGAEWSSVSGGWQNEASGSDASVSGGGWNRATGGGSAVSGGAGNTASGNYAAASGGSLNAATGDWSSVSGGKARTVSDDGGWRAGDLFQPN